MPFSIAAAIVSPSEIHSEKSEMKSYNQHPLLLRGEEFQMGIWLNLSCKEITFLFQML